MSEHAQPPADQPVTPAETDLMSQTAALRRAAQGVIGQALEAWNQYRVARTAQLQADAAPFLDRMLTALAPIIEAHERDQAEAFRAYQQVRDEVTGRVEEETRRLREEHMARMAELNADRPTCGKCGSTRLVPGGCLNCMYPPGAGRPTQARRSRVDS